MFIDWLMFGIVLGMVIGVAVYRICDCIFSDKRLKSKDMYVRQYDAIRKTYVRIVNQASPGTIIRLSVDEIKKIISGEADINYVIKYDFDTNYTNLLYVLWPVDNQEDTEYVVDFSYLPYKKFIEIQHLLYDARVGSVKQESVEQYIKQQIAETK